MSAIEPETEQSAEQMGAAFVKAWHEAENEALKSENDRLKAAIKESAMQAMAHDLEWERWSLERSELRRERDRLAAENVDLKNQLADIKHEMEMHRWLK